MVTVLFNKVFNEIWPMLVVFIATISCIRFFYIQNHHEKFVFYKEVVYLISIIYIWLLFTILTMTELNNYSGMNLVPFSEILRYKVGTSGFYYNVIGNILIFLPFGYLIGVYIKPKKIWPIIITTIMTSTIVEFVQLKIGRSFDIDDIILNIIGGIIGYLLYIGLSAIHKRLPDIFKNDVFYNIITVILIILFLIYVLGYWGVIFK